MRTTSAMIIVTRSANANALIFAAIHSRRRTTSGAIALVGARSI